MLNYFETLGEIIHSGGSTEDYFMFVLHGITPDWIWDID